MILFSKNEPCCNKFQINIKDIKIAKVKNYDIVNNINDEIMRIFNVSI